ncbi:MAG: DEAD/DEAH box helicase [Thaumarchaeota archaeon]|nr:DEAD/DEAH box helicase [Nitrososphaerota archaeon]
MVCALLRYRCPKCSSKVEVRRLFDGRHLASCAKCRLMDAVSAAPNMDEAYLKFLEHYDSGLCKSSEDLDAFLAQEGVIRSSSNVRAMLKEETGAVEDLPKIVSDAAFSKSDYLVSYRELKAEEPEADGAVRGLDVDEVLAEAAEASGISRLYRFQSEAVSLLLEGEDVVIVAPTGSGKTEAFAIPVIELVRRRVKPLGPLSHVKEGVQALFIYPTKALARDQFPRLRKLADPVGLDVKVFDGDTSTRERREFLESPSQIVVTNFDVIHYHLLHRTPFSMLLKDVKHIVVDDVHVYTGTFGSNVNWILKRLARVCGGFQVAAASATISNPKEFCEELFSKTFRLVRAEGGRRGKSHFLMLFPSLRSHLSLAIDLVKKASSSNYRTLCFSNSHLGAELTAFYGRRNGVNIEVHRAGLLPAHRKRVEDLFKRGLLPAIACTTTLELGVDIGATDAVVSDLVNVTSLVQRTGRAGRRGQESVVFLALRDDDPISQYYRNHPRDYFQDVAAGYVYPGNPAVAERHLLAAAMDMPLGVNEFPEFMDVVEGLEEKGLLKRRSGFFVPEYQAARRFLLGFDIRGGGEPVHVFFSGKKIGERGLPMALEELHPNAVYFLAGWRYRVQSLSVGHPWVARVERLPPSYPYYTRAVMDEHPSVLKVHMSRRVFGVEVAYCDLLIEKKVIGYVNRVVSQDSDKGETIPLEAPVEYEFKTRGLVFSAPFPDNTLSSVVDERRDHVAASSFHGSEHVTIEGTNMISGGAARDMGGLSMGSSGLIFIYDGSFGGNGATRLLFDRLDLAFKRAHTILSECSCESESGCPRCTYSYRCGNNNNYLHRGGAKEVLERILEGERTDLPAELGADRNR